MTKRYTMIVKDSVGVLDRITGFIRRNGWNLDRINVEPLAGTHTSTMQMELNLNSLESRKFEQRLHEWNFIFEVQSADEKETLA